MKALSTLFIAILPWIVRAQEAGSFDAELAIRASSSEAVLTWKAEEGRQYKVQVSNNLRKWDDVPGANYIGAGDLSHVIDREEQGDQALFYRVIRMAGEQSTGSPIITEFMARNDNTLRDEDGDSPDWVELFNPTQNEISLNGWFLTDDPEDLTRWTFPDHAALAPNGHLLVFASGKDRDLHTDFRLNGSGDYLALVRPDGMTVVSEFGETDFPEQFEDISYGRASGAVTTALIKQADPMEVYVGDVAVAEDWRTAEFESGEKWTNLANGIGFEDEGAEFVLPVSYWSFDDESVEDQTGNHHAESIMNAGFSGDAAPNGGSHSLDLSKADDYVRLPSVDFGISDQYSLAAWVKVTGRSERSFLSIKRDLTANGGDRSGVSLGVQNGHVYAGVISSSPDDDEANDAAETFHDIQGNQDVSIGPEAVWTHVAATLKNDVITTYVDGIADTIYTGAGNEGGQLKVPGAGLDFTDANGSFTGFGADGNAPEHRTSLGDFTRLVFDGLLDEVAIWNSALAGDQIRLLSRGEASPLTIPNPGEGPISLAPWIATEVSDLADRNSFQLRIPFESIPEIDSLALRLRHTDAFVAYLNGVEIARRSKPADAVESASIDVTTYLSELRPGRNILSIEATNPQAEERSFLILPELLATSDSAFKTGFFLDPTPAQPNEGIPVLTGPMISEITHTPHQPGGDADVTVSANLTPRLGPVDTVTLVYRHMYGQEREVLMHDQGDGLYRGTFSRKNLFGPIDNPGEMWRYFVKANDVNGNESRYPAFLRPENSAEYFGLLVEDPSIPATKLPIFEWFLPDPKWHRPEERTLTTSSLFYQGRFYDNIRVRLRGGVTTRLAKPNYKFDFYKGGRFIHDPELPSVEEINLQSFMGEIWTPTYMRNPLAYQVFRDSGTAASFSKYVHVRQNGVFYGLHAIEEQVDDTFLERRGLDPEGALYKASNDAWLKPEPSPSQYNKGTRKEEDFSDLAAFTVGLSLEDDQERERFLMDHVNLPQVIHYLAMTILGPNHDRLSHNYYVYRDTNGTGEWSMFPWDLDRWFGMGQFLSNPGIHSIFYGDRENERASSGNVDQFNRLNEALFDTFRTREMYTRHVRTVIDRWMNTSYFEDHIDAFEEQISLDADLDHKKWRIGTLANGVTALKSQISTHRGLLDNDSDIPDAFGGIPRIVFGAIETNPESGNQDEQYIELINRGNHSIDLSGWRLTGGVEFEFQAGTVLPKGSLFLPKEITRLYLSPNAKAFRARSTSPTGGEGLFVQGPYRGRLSSESESVELVDREGAVIATTHPMN
ncbi:MAG: CotH kinase family protein [Verrucomicrobiota bacterium]